MPTVDQLCEQYGLNNVDLEYSDADYRDTLFKLFTSAGIMIICGQSGPMVMEDQMSD